MEDIEILLQVERDDPGFIFQALARRARNSYWFYIRVILDYRWCDPWFHGEEVVGFLNKCEQEKKDALVLLPRDHGKTGLITQPRVAWEWAKDKNARCIICNAAEEKAGEMARATGDIVLTNQLYKLAFPEVRPTEKWGENGYYLNTSFQLDDYTYQGRVDPNLKSYGLGSNLTGAHPNAVLIIDDLINAKMADSPTKLENAEEFFREVVNCATHDCTIIACATRWTYNDYAGKIQSGELVSRRGKFETILFGITTPQVDGTHKITWPKTTYIDVGGKTVTVGHDENSIENLKKTARFRFGALYYNNPVMGGDQKFVIPLIKTFPTEYDKPFQTGPVAGLSVENEGQQKALIDAFRTQIRLHSKQIPLLEAKSKRVEKEIRIMAALQPWINEGKFNVRRDLLVDGLAVGFRKELETFPKGDNDILDAVSYATVSAARDTDLEYPLVHIHIDPGFSDNEQSCYTAIAVVCKYLGEIWLLDVIQFLASDTNYTIKMAFNIFDKYDKLAFSQERPAQKLRHEGFSSYEQRRRPFGRKYDNDIKTFDLDIESLRRR